MMMKATLNVIEHDHFAVSGSKEAPSFLHTHVPMGSLHFIDKLHSLAPYLNHHNQMYNPNSYPKYEP